MTCRQLLSDLTHDFGLEGWLYKIGPRAGDQYRRRWFTLDDRNLMYHDQPLVRAASTPYRTANGASLTYRIYSACLVYPQFLCFNVGNSWCFRY